MDIDKTTIYQTVSQILHEDCHIPHETITLESRLQEDLGLDSVGLMTLALEIENHWELILEESSESPPETVSQIIDLISIRLQEQKERES